MMGGLLELPRERGLGEGWSLRLLTAREEMECRREGLELAAEEGEGQEALCANACLVARVLRRRGKAVFGSGREALERLTAGQIARLAGQWGEFDQECDPGPWEEKAVYEAIKGWSARLMSAFSGVCSKVLALFRRRSGRRP